MAVAVPAQCAMALKEWASVLEAIGRGEQLVLVRKGGLIEPGSGFELVSPSFVLYPTFEHQTVNYVRPSYQQDYERALQHRAPEGQVRLELFGIAVSSSQTLDPNTIQRLQEFHIYNDAFVTQRLKWQPKQPLTLVVVRAFRLPQPSLLPAVPRYAGCKSWVDLDSPVPLAGAVPVLEERAFQERLQRLATLLDSP